MAVRRIGVASIVVGFIVLAVAAYVVAGVGATLVVGGVELVLGGYVLVFVEARLEAARAVHTQQ